MRSIFVMVGILAGASALAASDNVCVRDFTNDGGLIPCNSMAKEFAWVAPVQPRPKGVCTRVYKELYCERAKEFERILSEEGREICVLNNDQPGVVNLCDGSSKLFVYVKRKP